MKTGANEQDMKCPRCGRFSLRSAEAAVNCQTCGYELSPGEAAKFRLYEMLKAERRSGRA